MRLWMCGLMALLALFFIGTVEGADWVVDDDNGTWADYGTIQEAINGSSADDKITVYEGWYNETVTVDVRVTITGNGSSDVVVNGSGSGSVITISASDTEVSGLNVTKAGPSGGDAAVYSLVTFYVHNCTFHDNPRYSVWAFTADDVRIENCAISSGWVGVSSGSNSRLNVSGNRVFDMSNSGISIDNTDECTIDNNSVRNTTRGVMTYNVDHGLFENNTVWDQDTWGMYWSGSPDCVVRYNRIYNVSEAIQMQSSSNRNVVHDNRINSSEDGIYIWGSSTDTLRDNVIWDCWFGFNLYQMSDLTVADNVLRDNQYGIYTSSISWTNITGMDIIGSSYGLQLRNTNNVTVWNCTFYDNDRAIYLRDSSVDDRVMWCDIMNCSNYGVDNTGSGTLNAERNWWNDIGGPSGEGYGSGESVTTGVDFEPWYATNTTTPLREFVEVSYNPMRAYADTIDAGIDAANASCKVHVTAGQWDGDVTIDKQIHLEGAGVSTTVLNGTSTNPVITITASDVVVSDLFITNGTRGLTPYGGTYVHDCNISHNNGYGMMWSNGDDVTIEDCQMWDNGNRAIYGSYTDRLTSSRNTIGDHAEYTFGLYDADDCIIDNTTMVDNSIGFWIRGGSNNIVFDNLTCRGGSTHMLFDHGTDLHVKYSNFTDAAAAIRCDSDTSRTAITASDFNSLSDGIYLSESGRSEIHDCNFYRCTSQGVYVRENGWVNMSGLNFTSCGEAILLWDYHNATVLNSSFWQNANPVRQGGTSWDNAVHYCTLLGTTDRSYTQGGEDIDMELNWWGSADGPSGEGYGSGDEVGTGIDFEPWYATNTTTPLTEHVTVSYNPVRAYSDTVQGGIDASNSTCTVHLGMRFYDEQVTIDRSIDLVGVDVINSGFYGIHASVLVNVTADHVNISKMNITGGDYGVILQDADHCTISDCVVTDNYRRGIYINSSDRINITGCNVSHNGDGVFLRNTNWSTIHNSSICNNTRAGGHWNDGIRFDLNVTNVTIWGNLLSGNQYGIDLDDTWGPEHFWDISIRGNRVTDQGHHAIFGDHLNRSRIVDNVLTGNNGDGLYLTDSRGVGIRLNNVSDNTGTGIDGSGNSNITVSNNSFFRLYRGIYLDGGDNWTITYNEFGNNSYQGVYVSSQWVNRIHHNNFHDNNGGGIQAYNDGTASVWDDGVSEGNRWTDWNGTGNYTIDGNAGAEDRYPLGKLVNTSAPEKVPELGVLLTVGITVVVFAAAVRRRRLR